MPDEPRDPRTDPRPGHSARPAMTEVTAEWLASQGAVYHEPWWCLRFAEVWFNPSPFDPPHVIAVNENSDERYEVKTREQVLRMADGGLP